jgi:hypothetical protein
MLNARTIPPTVGIDLLWISLIIGEQVINPYEPY